MQEWCSFRPQCPFYPQPRPFQAREIRVNQCFDTRAGRMVYHARDTPNRQGQIFFEKSNMVRNYRCWVYLLSLCTRLASSTRTRYRSSPTRIQCLGVKLGPPGFPSDDL